MLLTALAILLEACTDCTQDPSKAGFFCGVRNIAQGTYQERQSALKTEAESSEAAARQRSDQVRALQSEEGQLSVEKGKLQKKLVSLQRDIDKQKRLLANARLQQRADQATLMELEARLKALQEKRIQLDQSDNTSLQEVENLKHDIEHLQGNINYVLKLTTVE